MARNAYRRGDFQPIPLADASARLLAAAATGNPDAQYMLGLMYLTGAGLEPDEHQAALWIRKAAGQGLARAQNDLGTLYAEGRGVQLDLKQALFWLNCAADQGLLVARENLLELAQHTHHPHSPASSPTPSSRQ